MFLYYFLNIILLVGGGGGETLSEAHLEDSNQDIKVGNVKTSTVEGL